MTKTNIGDNQLFPLYGNILVEELPEDEVSRDEVRESGLIVRGGNVDKHYSQLGKVIAVGIGDLRADGTLQKIRVEVGDTIAYSVNTPQRLVRSLQKDYVILSEREIYGVYSKDDNK